MSVSGNDFGRASAPDKHISDYDAGDVEQAVVAGRLWSEELERAGMEVRRLDNADLNEAFNDTVTQLLSGEYAKKGGNGFGLRSSLGYAIQDLLSDTPDIGRFNRLIDDKTLQIGHDKALKAALKALRAELKAHLAEQGRKPFDGYDPATASLILASERKM